MSAFFRFHRFPRRSRPARSPHRPPAHRRPLRLEPLEDRRMLSLLTWSEPAALNNAAIDSGDDWYPSITTDGQGDWVALWRSWDSLAGTIGADADILFARSSDAGQTWSSPQALNTDAATDSRDDSVPQLTTDGQGNWLAVWASHDDPRRPPTSSESDILFARSTDAGQTWSSPQAINVNAAADSVPQVTTDGQGNWIVVWQSNDSLGGTIGTDKDILFARSTDDGQSWSPPQALNRNASVDNGNDYSPQLSTDGEGNWVAVWESDDTLAGTIGPDRDILFARSTDTGQTWSAPQPLNASAGTDAAWDEDWDEDPQLTTDPLGNWVAVWSFREGWDGVDADILTARSTDAGQTWSAPQVLNTNASTDLADDAKPRLSTDGHGNWVAVWYTVPLAAAGTDILFAHSTDAAQTWSPPESLNRNATTFPDDAWDANPEITTDGQGTWIAVWHAGDESLDSTIGGDGDILFARAFLPAPDFGDAPSPYPTLLVDDAARHDILPGFYLGAGVDAESDGRPDAGAMGDDVEGTPDDEDGVEFLTPLVPGSMALVEVTGSQPGVLNAWIDFGDDGSWAEPEDHALWDRALEAGTNTLSFRVPAAAILTPQTFARFRLTSAPGISYDGLAADGEVEDYEVAITWFGPTEALNTNAETDSGDDWDPQLVTDGTGNWVAAWTSNDSLGDTIGSDYDILFSRSMNSGHSWSAPQPLNANAGTDSGGDAVPQLVTDGTGNWVAVWGSNDSLGGTIGSDSDLLFAHSTDAGQTWSTPQALNANAATDSGNDGSPQMTADDQGNLGVMWYSHSTILFARSTDGGHTWSPPQTLGSNIVYNGSALTTDGQGNWVVVWVGNPNRGHSDILFARSTDAGQSWSTPRALNANSGQNGDPRIATDAHGNWVAIWVSLNTLGGTIVPNNEILFARSTDAGQTWSAPEALNADSGTDSGNEYLPQLTTDPQGNFFAVWDSEEPQFERLFARSTDAGRTWSTPQPLNSNMHRDSGNEPTPQLFADGRGGWLLAWSSFRSPDGAIWMDDFDIHFATTYAQLTGRHVFYNDSTFDDGPAANAADDGAIAPDKVALMPGETATFSNVSSYSKGINGIMLDVAGLADPRGLGVGDFEFRRGNDDAPGDWGPAAAPASITVRPGEGVDGSDRVTIVWPDYDPSDPENTAVGNAWLQVTMLATPSTGLVAPEVFYWGSAIGDSGYGNAPGVAAGDVYDAIAAMLNPHDAAAIDDFADYNRDGAVDALDVDLVRRLRSGLADGPLQLITAPPQRAGTAPPVPVDAPSVPLPPGGEPGYRQDVLGTPGDDRVATCPGRRGPSGSSSSTAGSPSSSTSSTPSTSTGRVGTIRSSSWAPRPTNGSSSGRGAGPCWATATP